MSRQIDTFSSKLERLQQSCMKRMHCASTGTVLTIALLASGGVPPALGEDRSAGDDLTAAQLLQQVRHNREVLSADFPGFRSAITVTYGGRTYRGSCQFSLPGKVQVTLQGDQDLPGVTETIQSMLLHRVPGEPGAPQGVRYAEPDESPLGTKILFSDEYDSAYRIRDGQITQVDRRLGDHRLVITVLESTITESGRYLPRHVFVARFDKPTGQLHQAWAYTSRYQRVGVEYLPLSRQVTRIDPSGPKSYRIEWDSIELLEPRGED